MAYNSSNYNDHHSQPSYGSDAHYGIPNRTGSQPAEAGLPSYRDYDDSYAGGGAENHQRHLSYDDGRGGPPPAPPIKDHSAFLNKDPYGTIAQHASRAASSSYHDLDANLPGGSRVSPALMRSDTIKPTDSISQYAPNSDPSDVTTDRPASRIVRHQAQESYSSTHYGGGGYDEYPHRGSMGYAEDEEDEAKQLAKQPILFSNQLKSAEADYYTYGDAPTHAGGLSGAKQAYPFSGYAGAAEPAYGAAVGPYGFPKGSLQESIEKRRRGVRRQKYPILTYIFAVAYLIVFIIELVRSGQLTGSAIQTHPSFNPMIGPSFEFLINFGARYTPCMRKVPEFDASQVKLPCLQYANADTGGRYTENQLCTAAEICGLTDPTNPNQMWRLVVPIFLHAGVVHILFNLLAQIFLGAEIEKLLGSVAYIFIYMVGGVGSNLLGANFGLISLPSVGASGAIFTCIGVEITDLIYNWKYEARAKLRLGISVFFALVSLALGLLPYTDNFAHIGGFAIGILGGLVFGPSIHATRRHRIVVWVIRLISAALLVAFVVGLGVNFVTSPDPAKACPFCRNLSCLKTFSQCQDGAGYLTSGTSAGSNPTSAASVTSSSPLTAPTDGANFNVPNN